MTALSDASSMDPWPLWLWVTLAAWAAVAAILAPAIGRTIALREKHEAPQHVVDVSWEPNEAGTMYVPEDDECHTTACPYTPSVGVTTKQDEHVLVCWGCYGRGLMRGWWTNVA